MMRNSPCLSSRPSKTRPHRLARLAAFVEERIAAVGGITEDALALAGFRPEELAELRDEVRARLVCRGLAY